jgi:Na+-driven multidrug efflux pump
MGKLKQSLSNIDLRLFLSLIVLGLCPTIYTTVRVFFLGQFPGDWSFSIAGQLSWVNLLYEVISEALILPLFFFIGKVKQDRKAFSNCVRTGMLVSGIVYAVLSAVISIFAAPLLAFMAADPSIIAASTTYIRIESMANIFSILSQFALVALVSLNRSRYIYILTGFRLVFSLVFDTFLVSSLPVSLNLGVNGIGYSNILVNLLLLAVSLALLRREGVNVFIKGTPDFGWIKGFLKVGGISGLESLVRNAAYMLMVARMVNVVGEQGTYWVANNFIWGWLLLPILQLGELIKEETAANRDSVRENTLGYFAITGVVCVRGV